MRHSKLVSASFGLLFAAALVAGCTSASNNPAAGTSTFPCDTSLTSATGTVSNLVDGTAANFPTLGLCASTITFQSGTTIASGTSITATTSLSAPALAPSPMPTNPAGTNAPTPIDFIALSLTAGSITIPAGANASPSQTVTLASTGSCSTYYQLFGTSGGWQGYGSAGTLSGLTVTFPTGTNSGSSTLTPGTTYYLAYVCF